MFCLLVITTRWFRSSTQVEQKQNQHTATHCALAPAAAEEERGTELRWRKEEGKKTASGGGGQGVSLTAAK